MIGIYNHESLEMEETHTKNIYLGAVNIEQTCLVSTTNYKNATF